MKTPRSDTEKKQAATVLVVAGSDPSGGAGIQADLKTLTVIGVYGGAAVTCLTVQNTRGVREVSPLEAGLVRRQIEAVLDDLNITHIKIGMVGNAAVAAAIAATLRNYRGEVICDPVLTASSGKTLLAEGDLASFTTDVLDRATVLTPNLEELGRLTDMQCRTEAEMAEAATKLLHRHERLRAVAVKGGHQPQEDAMVTDRLFRRASSPEAPIIMTAKTHPRISTANSHGTGCTFAAAFTGYHLLTGDDITAFEKSVQLLDRLLRGSAPYVIGHGRGPLLHHLAGEVREEMTEKRKEKGERGKE